MIVNEPGIGDVGLLQVSGFTGRFIRVAQFLNGTKWRNSKFEHSLLYLGNGMAVEAQPGGAILYNLEERWGGTPITWVHVADLDKTDETCLILEASKVVGTPYSFLDYVAILVHRLRLPLPGLKKYVSSTKHMICSQLVAEVYQRVGVRLFEDEWPGYVTPADYYEKFGG